MFSSEPEGLICAMTHVLLVKTSSMGDVVHTLPAVTDARALVPGITFDWVVEEAFTDIPASHPAVNEVIPVAMRRWRKNIMAALVGEEFRRFRAALRRNCYDLVIDAQGLMKSALITRLAGVRSVGLSWESAREPLCSLLYRHKVVVSRNQHAVERIRSLFAKALEYNVPPDLGSYGIRPDAGPLSEGFEEYCHTKQILFNHGTIWESKRWPLVYWQQLLQQVNDSGYRVLLPWGDEIEKQRAELIAGCGPDVTVLPKLTIRELIGIMASVEGVVSGDTGLGHLAVACGVPTVSVLGPTDPGLSGSYGANQRNVVSDHLPCIPCMKRRCKFALASDSNGIHPPCFAPLTPAAVWSELTAMMKIAPGPDQNSRERAT